MCIRDRQIQYLGCPDDATGGFTATGTGGVAPYQYSTDNGVTWNNTGIFSNLAAGNYLLRVQDASGCSKDSSISINVLKAEWTGISSSNWHDAANWSINAIPDANTHVIIPAGTPNPCLVSLQDAAAASIQVKTGGLFNIQNNRKLNILSLIHI